MADGRSNAPFSSSALGCPDDLRSLIAMLEQEGELRRVEAEIDWRFEAGAMSRLVTERRGPAPLFERIKDYPVRASPRLYSARPSPTSMAVSPWRWDCPKRPRRWNSSR